MITAIPVTKEHISGHFTKAESFIFINAEGRIVCHHINPAREGGCAEKKALLNMLQRQNAQRVIVRHIGERMLGKLLSRELSVFKTHSGNIDVQALCAAHLEGFTPLTDAQQGKRSPNYETKKAVGGGCGCSHEGSEHDHGDCHHDGGKRCCDSH
ncbi:Dinitrogenase iron-molybdenum cofactor [Leminorella richardii]|uniref:Dinitrogenase iron-molybdenum cofactor n=1 Tax=Leminorella richardii TaxID=158841 RepID=A0A2X4U9M5_9GAMM|nr:NifB/NifX family molybdenum-iron cluster-binding protein [Leminorella richardii]SQI35641.1 Dinitrogenase iron-molybdenum cofactor [Leminorella richardii]